MDKLSDLISGDYEVTVCVDGVSIIHGQEVVWICRRDPDPHDVDDNAWGLWLALVGNRKAEEAVILLHFLSGQGYKVVAPDPVEDPYDIFEAYESDIDLVTGRLEELKDDLTADIHTLFGMSQAVQSATAVNNLCNDLLKREQR